MEEKAKQFTKRIPKVQDLEVELGLPENVKDSELVEVEKVMNKQIEIARKAIRSQSITEAQAVEDAKPKPVEDEGPRRVNEWKK